MIDSWTGPSPTRLLQCLAVVTIAGWLLALKSAVGQTPPQAEPMAAQGEEATPRKTVAVEELQPDLGQFVIRLQQTANTIKQLKDEGFADHAARIEGEFKKAIELARGTYAEYRIQQSNAVEVHCIGLKEGADPPKDKTGLDPDFADKQCAEVHVTYTSRPVVLVLSAYKPVHWRVRTVADAKLIAIVLLGAKGQTLSSKGKHLMLNRAGSRHPTESTFPILVEGKPNFRFGAWAHNVIGYEVTTLQLFPTYDGAPLVVGPNDKAWRAQHLERRVRSVLAEAQRPLRERLHKQLKDLRFEAVYYPPVATAQDYDFPRAAPGGTSQFTIDGPIRSTLRPLPRNVEQPVLYKSDDESLTFAVGEHRELLISEGPLDAEPQEVTTDPKLVERGKVSTIALDTKRDRLLCATRGAEPKLVALDLQTAQWSKLADTGAVRGLSCSPEKDVVYTLTPNYHDDGLVAATSRLVIYDPSGKKLKEVESNFGFLVGDTKDPEPVALRELGEYLVVVSSPLPSRLSCLEGRIDVLDRNSAKVIYSAVPRLHDGQPGPSPAVAALPVPKGSLAKLLTRLEKADKRLSELRGSTKEAGRDQLEHLSKALAKIRGRMTNREDDPPPKNPGKIDDDPKIERLCGQLDEWFSRLPQQAENSDAKLLAASFQIMLQQSDAMDRQPRAVLAQCTSQGLIAKSEIPLPPGCTYAVCDPQGKVCYFVDKEGLQQFDLTTKRHSTLPYPKEFTSTRKVSGMAFDSKRRRLLVANAQRSGSIHALDLATKEWTAVGNVENWGMHGLAYEPDTDVFYGIGFNLRGRTGLLMTMSPEGAILRSVHVDLNLRDVIRDASLVQLAVVDDHVVVIVTGNAAGFRSDPGQGRIDIVDPRTGKRKFSGALEPKAAEK